ncbi:MAG: AAA family ATPase [Candidatus Bathyarchaeia archaeon]
MSFTVKRREEDAIRNLRGWLLVYGRRKTGKTFLLRTLREAKYFIFTRSGYCLFEEDKTFSSFNAREAIRLAGSLLDKGETVILDEFQRLPDIFWEEIALHHPNGKLIACGSSLGIIKKVFDRRSPLLGLLAPFKVDIIRYSDAVNASKKICKSLRDALLWGLVIRDPWIIPMVTLEEDLTAEISKKLPIFSASSSGLIGEVFEEEERSLTRVYDAVLRLVGEGLWKPSEISGILTSNNLISGGLSTVTGLLERLAEMGLIEKITLWKTRGARHYYKHRSPLLSITYYIDQKLNIAEGTYKRVDPNLILEVISKEAQFSLGEMLAEYHEGTRSYTILPNGKGDIDIVILDQKGKRPIIGYEVKLGEIGSNEAKKAIEAIHSYGIPRAGLVSLSSKPPMVPGAYEALGPEDLISIAEKVSSAYFETPTSPKCGDINIH